MHPHRGPRRLPAADRGVGVGGTFEQAARLSKKALFRELGRPTRTAVAAVEREVLERANRLGIGPQGYGGDTTAFGIHILTYPVPHHEPAGGGDDRVPRASPQRGDAVSVTIAADGIKDVTPPLSDADVESLKAGDRVRITGVMYTARDAAHGRLLPLIERASRCPIDVRGQIIYYTGPSPARPGDVVGSIGPTTGGPHGQVHPEALVKLRAQGHLGKGARSQPVKDALRQYKAVYFGAIGGAGAVLSRFVQKLEIVAYEDLGTEAIRRLEVRASRPSWSTIATAAISIRTAEGVREGGRHERRNGAGGMARVLVGAAADRGGAPADGSVVGAAAHGGGRAGLSFIVYSTWAAFQNANYFADPYLSPFYSPCLSPDVPARDASAAGAAGRPMPIIGVLSPAFLILWGPGPVPADLLLLPQGLLPLVLSGRRRPARCPTRKRATRGETRFPFILQNIHRYFFWYLAVLVHRAAGGTRSWPSASRTASASGWARS